MLLGVGLVSLGAVLHYLLYLMITYGPPPARRARRAQCWQNANPNRIASCKLWIFAYPVNQPKDVTPTYLPTACVCACRHARRRLASPERSVDVDAGCGEAKRRSVQTVCGACASAGGTSGGTAIRGGSTSAVPCLQGIHTYITHHAGRSSCIRGTRTTYDDAQQQQDSESSA